MVEQRLVSGKPFDEDVGFDQSLRPQTLREYVGQSQVVANLRVAIEAARSRGDALDHVLLFGPPGVGKTSLAHVIAAELGVTLKATSGPVIERAGDLAAILTALEAREILFVDEIHRLDAKIEEILYPALEDCALDLIIGTGPGARTMRIPLKPFTLVAATTRAGLLTGPLRGRFGIVHRLDFYSPDELDFIVTRSARPRGVEERRALPTDCCDACGTTPRFARTESSPRTSRWRPSRCSTSTSADLTKRIVVCCSRSSRSSAVGRLGWARWQLRSARTRTPSRTSTSPICCRSAFSIGLNAVASPRVTRMNISAVCRLAPTAHSEGFSEAV